MCTYNVEISLAAKLVLHILLIDVGEEGLEAN